MSGYQDVLSQGAGFIMLSLKTPSLIMIMPSLIMPS